MYRFAAYKSYIYWIYEKLSRNNRRVVPACAVTAIRAWFPEEDERYEGFHEANVPRVYSFV